MQNCLASKSNLTSPQLVTVIRNSLITLSAVHQASLPMFGLFAVFSHLHYKLQVAPGAALLMRILEDFIHLIGEAQKPFQSFLVVTNNLSKSLNCQKVCVMG